MTNQLNSPWTEERNELLRALWPTMSASAIGRQLGTTRGAVIGRAHRMKLAPKEKSGPSNGHKYPWKRKMTKSQPQRRANAWAIRATDNERPEQEKPAPVRLAPVRAPVGVTLLELDRHHCRYIVGPIFGLDTLYCGRDRVVGSYCAEHDEICHTTNVRRDVRPFWRAA
jgi:hypothetical protein